MSNTIEKNEEKKHTGDLLKWYEEKIGNVNILIFIMILIFWFLILAMFKPSFLLVYPDKVMKVNDKYSVCYEDVCTDAIDVEKSIQYGTFKFSYIKYFIFTIIFSVLSYFLFFFMVKYLCSKFK